MSGETVPAFNLAEDPSMPAETTFVNLRDDTPDPATRMLVLLCRVAGFALILAGAWFLFDILMTIRGVISKGDGLKHLPDALEAAVDLKGWDVEDSGSGDPGGPARDSAGDLRVVLAVAGRAHAADRGEGSRLRPLARPQALLSERQNQSVTSFQNGSAASLAERGAEPAPEPQSIARSGSFQRIPRSCSGL